jgi:hypothetical protein
MNLTCTVCGAPLAVEGIDLERKVARCLYCRSVFDLEGRKAPALGDTGIPVRLAPRARVPMPERFQVDEEPGLLRISWRWFSWILIMLAFFCVAWDGFLLFWYGIAFTQKDVPWVMIVFPVAHVAVGVGLTYRTLCGFVNKTVVEVSRRSLRIHHGPLPWFGSRDYDARDLKQLYCEEQRGKDSDSGTNSTYTLTAVMRDGRRMKLLDGLVTANQALYLEEQLEARLHIEDEPVPGELVQKQSMAG